MGNIMNYKKVYGLIIKKAKNENRKKTTEVYYEKHHIIPDFMFIERKRKGPKGHLPGNPNDPNNLVLLTPREHFLCHVLLHKICKGTRYEYSAGSALGFFFTKQNHPREHWFSYAKKYAKWRLQGLDAISKARSGMMPVKDAITGEMIGSIDTNHPKVISGEWIHHTKGRKVSIEEQAKRKPQDGTNNNNYKLITPEIEQVIFDCVSVSLDNNNLIQKIFVEHMRHKLIPTYFKKLSIVFIKNNYGSMNQFVEFYNITHNTNILYDPYYRGSIHQMRKINVKNKKNNETRNSASI
jgi:hypothetical protein